MHRLTEPPPTPFFFSSRRRHTRCSHDWSSDVCSSDLPWPRGWVNDSVVPKIVLFTTAAYLVIAFAGVDTTGGKSLGPRLLLPLLPLLTVPAIMRIAAYVRASGSIERWVGGAGVALAAMTLVIHGYGTTVAYYARNQHDASAVLTLAAARERIVVADDPYTAQLLFPLYYRK